MRYLLCADGIVKENLLKQNHPSDQIYVTGNTAIDAMHETIKDDYRHEIFNDLDPRKKWFF